MYVAIYSLLNTTPSSLYKSLLLISQMAASITLFGLILSDSAQPLYCNLRFKLTLIVPVPLGSCGKILTVLLTSADTLTTLPCILSCFPLGACISF